jgi:phenylpropionate dioxygenase-like ring-hydroxylating dioxygenase large terminal subunit
MSERFPFPLPNGWFQVAFADELAPGQLTTVHYFDQDLVLFRSEAGEAFALDPFCPHLGAHLGFGGRVVGDRVRCPFHAWEFTGEGQCVRVPYAKKIPPKAKLRSWPLLERNGMLYVHFHKEGAAPAWEPPVVPEYGSDEWTDYWRRDWVVASCAQEMAENSVDPAHFKYVHRTAELPAAEARTDAHVFHVDMGYPIRMGEQLQQGRIEIDCFGFGVGVTRFRGIVDTTVVVSGTPIDGEHLHHRLSFMVKKLDSVEATEGLGRAFVSEITRQFEEDKPIWESKIHLERPALCDGDGPIGELRRWGRQFY